MLIKHWYSGKSDVERGHWLCKSLGIDIRKGKATLLDAKVPAWAMAIGHLAGLSAWRPRYTTLRTAGSILAKDEEKQRAFAAAGQLGGTRAEIKFVIQLVHPEMTIEREAELRDESRFRQAQMRARHAREKLAEHQKKLATEQRLVKKWERKVRAYDRREDHDGT